MTSSNSYQSTHATTSTDYRNYYDNFEMSSLLQEIFGEHPEDRLNAYMACCGRHVRDGREDNIALVHEDTAGKITRMTFAELDQQSVKVAQLLKSYGVQAGDQVATMLPRTPELLIIVLATWRIGAIYQPLFTAFGYDSIKYRLDKAATKVVFTNQDNRDKFKDLAQQTKMVMVDGSCSEETQAWEDDNYFAKVESMTASIGIDPVLLDTDDSFLQLFTSGTVGKSKGVSVPLSALPAFYLYMRYAIDLRETDNFWNMADPGWAYGLYYAITGPLLLGITTYFNEAGFDATNTRDFMLRHKITNLASSPTAFRMMKSSGVFDEVTNDGSENDDHKLSLRCASSAGETLNTEVVGWVKSHLGCQICDQYGQTETGMICCEHHALTHKCPVGSMGMALPGHTLVVLDDDMQVLPDGEQGQLAVVVSQSPAFYFVGYSWNEKQAFNGDYYLTGDMVERHNDGTYWFSGRDDDIITTAGYRVGPTDVENTVLEHEAVAESAAVGIPDEARGHIIKSFVVLKDGIEGSDEISQQIKNLVRERLSTHSFPREVEFVTALPKTPSGKIQRFLLRSLSAE